MTPAVAEPTLAPPERATGPRRGTLDELVAAAWTELTTRGRSGCPVCDAELRAEGEAPAVCVRCRSTLS